MKRILSFLMITAMVSVAIISCKDDFNEEDFLRLQAELKNQQDSVARARDKAAVDSTSEQAVREFIAASNEAGDLLSVTLLVRENGVAVPGVAVTLTTSTASTVSGGRAKAVQNGTTDASGNVVFDRVVIGSGTISFSKTGYIGATATVDFGTPSAPQQIQVQNPNGNGTVTRYVSPPKRFEEGIMPMLSANAVNGSTATIRGRVSIENDVTNLTAEVPTGIVLRANFSALAPVGVGAFITNIVLEDNSGLGVATVAANGDYTMTVPATAAGITISLIVPNIEGVSRMAVNGYDDGTGTIINLATPEYRDVPTSWGPQAPVGFGTIIPGVAGARVVIPAAPAVGTGFTFDLTRVSESIPTGSITSSGVQSVGNTFYRINKRGAYLPSIPSVTITGGGGVGATATATMRTVLTAVNVTNAGTGYTSPSTLRIMANLQDGSTTQISEAAFTYTGSTIPTTLDLNVLDGDFGGFGFDDAATLNLPVNTVGLSLVVFDNAGTGATATGTFSTELASVAITNGGSGYTTAPTFNFTGGGLTDGSADHAAIEVLEYPVLWELTPNNSAATDYLLEPEFAINYPATANVAAQNNIANISLFSSTGVQEIASEDLSLGIGLSNGDLVKMYPGRRYITTFERSVAPTVLIVNETPINARFTFIAADIDLQTGAVIDVPTVVSFGNGYNVSLLPVAIVPTITGAPGTGGMFSLTSTFAVANQEFTYSAPSITSAGTGYLPNLNRRPFQAPAIPVTVSAVQTGKTYTADIVYGTGNRRVNIN
jgi:hypothetical protein